MTAEQEHPTSDDPAAAPDPDSNLFKDESDINDDRQDPPVKTEPGAENDEVDGMRATPGDDEDDR